ncbi:MAG: 3-methylornithyl-N6-L-lysine dehydrogenase PylD [Desulfobulbaceae bacterium]|jgi:pyrrolysine biosynthesis protein PylD|nr:3-methylornithyl-N6-L-lysine dehydrogenase PylD [Desulfobulbaceae bacterium]
MTRLAAADICGLRADLAGYDAHLRRLCGQGLLGVAAHAACLLGQVGSEAVLPERLTVAAIAVSYGEGMIEGFAESLAAICGFLGADAFVTEQTNIMGLAEAVQGGADIIMLSDDDDLVALNPAQKRFAHNSPATGRAFAAALALAAGGFSDREVLVIGAGPVGAAAAAFIHERGGTAIIHDQSRQTAARLAAALPGATIATDLKEAMRRHDLVIEATPSADVIKSAWLRRAHRIAAPGVPLGVEDDGGASGALILHDTLALGVATMLCQAIGR